MFPMTLKRAAAVLTLGTMGVGMAQAAVVDFEDLLPTFLSPSITSAGYTITSNGFFSGVDSAAAFSSFGNAPDNSTGQFLYALNDDAVTIDVGGGRILGLDAAFIAPLTQAAGTLAGRLQIAAQTADGLVNASYDFGVSGTSGNWSFFTIDTDALAGSSVTSLTFSACVYDGLGGCARDASLSQFAIDNLRIPEPTSAALALAAFGLLAATRRRQAR